MSKILIDEEFWNGHTYSEVEEYIKGKLGTKVNSADLATIATSGSYDDLSDKPTIPDISGKADSSDVYTKTEVYTKEEIDALLSDFVTEEIVDKSYGYHQNIKFIDLGVRLNGDKILFAESNIGASSPEELGTYFAWGETTKRYQDYPTEVDWLWSSYSLSSDGVGSDFTKYKYSSEFFSQADDAANVNLGGKWRTPTVGEIEKLLECTSRMWTNNYKGTGVSGFVISGQGDYSDNSIFLPASGYMKNDLVGDVVMPTEKYKGVKCAYWTSSISVDSNDADTKKYSYSLVMDSSNSAVSESIERYCGLPIRPVVVVKDNAQEKIHRYSLNYQDGGAGFEIGGLIYYKTGNNRYELQNAENWKRSDDSDIRYKFKIDENIAGTNFGYSYYYNAEKYINSPYGGWKTIETPTLYTIFGTGNGVRYSLVHEAASNRISGTTVNGVDGCRFAKISITDLNKTGVLFFPNNETFVGAQLPVMDEPYFVPPAEGQSSGTWSYSTSNHQNEITESELNEYISQGAYFLEKDVYWTRSMSEIGVGYHWPIYYLGSGEVDLSGIGVYDGLSVAMNAIYIRNIPWWLADCDDISHDVTSTNVTPANLSDRIDNLENTKVDKVSGKGLSTNDYTTAEKNKLSGIESDAQVNVIETVKVNGTALTSENKAVDVTVPTKVSDLDNDSGYLTSHQDISGKVDKVEGKGLSTEDYTTEEKTKLSGIATGAQVNVIETVKVNGTALAPSSKAVDITVPDVSSFITKSVNDLTNYYTTSNTYTKTEVDNLIGGIEHFKYKIATSTSAVASPKSNILYLIGPIGDGSEDIDRYEEYVYPSAAAGWTKIGDTTIDLSDYVTKSTTVNGHALSGNVTVSASDVGLGNVGNFKAVSTVASQGLSSTEQSNARANIGAGTSSFSGSYNDLTDKPTIPTVPTNVSSFTNDAGYLTSHQDISGKVDKVEGKGLSTEDYTSEEKTKLSGIATGAQVNVIETVKVNGTALSPESKAVDVTVPTKVSDLTNDSGFTNNTGTITGITMNGSSKGTSGVVDLGTVITSHQDISGKQDVITDLAQIRLGATAGATAYQLPQNGIPARDIAPGVIPDVSQFITKDVDNLTNYPKTTVVNQAINDAIDSVPFAEGSGTDSAEQWNCMASGNYSVATGYNTTAKGQASHSEGNNTNAAEQNSHAEGYRTTANGANAHIEGRSQNKPSDETIVKGNDALIADWNASRFSLAKGNAAHAEGYNNLALGNYTHTEGAGTIAIGAQSHTEGNFTKTTNTAEHAEGNWNKSNTNTLHSVGIGGSEATRKNAHEIMQNGDHYIYGIGGYDGTNPMVARRIQDALMQCTGVKNIISLTKAEYDALANKDSETIYLVAYSHDYVDLGLRDGNNNKILFATCNIGASSPEEYGDYFAWGETSKRYTSISGDSVVGGSFTWDNCPYCTNSEGSKFSKYTDVYDEAAESGTADGKTVLEPVDDVATVLWGGNWRMPSQSDLEYLISDNVTRTWIDNYNETGISGILISGKDSFSESSIFFPSAGLVDGTTVSGAGVGGVYPCREIYGIIYINTLMFSSEEEAQVAPALVRYYGQSVRPVHVGDVVPSYKIYKGSSPINDTYSKSEIDEKIGDIESILVTL